jgi:hypothetical protein
MAAALGLQHEGERRVAVDVDVFDRVHLDSDFERGGHECSLGGFRIIPLPKPKARGRLGGERNGVHHHPL